MKKVLSLLLVMIAVISMFGVCASADESIDDITVYVNNEKVTFDSQPVIRNNRTLVPIRGVFEKLGARVDWNKETNQVIVKDDSMELLLEIGNSAVLVDGAINFLDTQSMLIDDRTMVPVRFIAESLGYKVSWDNTTHRIDIDSSDEPVLSDEGLPTVGSKEALIQLLTYSDNLNSYIQSRFWTDTIMVDDVMIQEENMDGSGMDFDDSSSVSNAVESEMAVEESAEASKDYSGTNDQVEGVEEGDIIKTDGDYIYYVKNNNIVIIDADPMNPEIVATVEVDTNRGYISDLYVSGSKLTVLGSSYVYYAYPVDMILTEKGSSVPYYNTANTYMLVYDLKDIEKPELTMDMDYEGSLVSSRLIEDNLYLVTNKYIDYYGLDSAELGVDDYAIKPKYMDNLNDTVTIIGYEDIYYFPHYIEPNFLMTVGVDLTREEVTVESYLGSAENVYASLDNLYLTFTDYTYTNEGEGLLYVPNYSINTAIYKFKLDDGSIIYKNEGKVSGTVVNQFSLDEYDNNLRIATTTGEMWNQSDPSTNNVFILDEYLEEIGKVTGLAEGERIYSTRFAGERIYMVTFRQVDPFFVIDASDPTNPKVLGELKIPGFSTYMHILDENHVLGFGKDTIDDHGFVQTGGFKLSLFDVTDPTNPVEKKNEIIGTSGTYSELEYNHKALMISLSKGIMGFPISVASTTPYSTDFVGAYVYDLSSDDFEFKGTITNMEDSKMYDYDKQIQRLLYIGDYVYTLSQGKMKVTSLTTMTTTGTLELD